MESGCTIWRFVDPEFLGHRANQAYRKSGIVSPGYNGKVNNPMESVMSHGCTKK